MNPVFKILEVIGVSLITMMDLINYCLENKGLLLQPQNAIALVVTGVAVLYGIYQYQYRYWRQRGIKGPIAIPFFGNFFSDRKYTPKANDSMLFKEYGDLVGIFAQKGKPVLYVSDAELIKEILISKFNSFSGKRDMSGHKVFASFLGSLNGADWKRMRTIISPTFSSGKMKAMMPLMDTCFIGLDEVISKNVGGKFNAKDLFSCFTMDVIAKCAFATEINSHHGETEFAKNAKNFFNFSFKRVFPFIFLPQFVVNMAQLHPFNPESFEYLVNACKTIMHQREKESASGQQRPYTDYVQLLLDAKNKENMNEVEFVASAIIVLVAGFETTATLLTYASYCLAMNPHVQDKLMKEIDASGDLDYETLFKMKYLDAFIMEVLRKYPPVIRIDRNVTEQVTLSNGLQLDPGVGIRFPVYSIHHDPRYYPEPEKFDPERFMPKNKDSLVPCTWLPFVDGPRNCVGKRFAEMEAKLALVKTLKKYRFIECSETKASVDVGSGTVLMSPKAVIVKIEKR